LKMIISCRALAGMVHRSTSSAEGKTEITGKSEMRVRVVEEVVDLLYLKKLYLVYADEMKITTGSIVMEEWAIVDLLAGLCCPLVSGLYQIIDLPTEFLGLPTVVKRGRKRGLHRKLQFFRKDASLSHPMTEILRAYHTLALEETCAHRAHNISLHCLRHFHQIISMECLYQLHPWCHTCRMHCSLLSCSRKLSCNY